MFSSNEKGLDNFNPRKAIRNYTVCYAEDDKYGVCYYFSSDDLKECVAAAEELRQQDRYKNGHIRIMRKVTTVTFIDLNTELIS